MSDTWDISSWYPSSMRRLYEPTSFEDALKIYRDRSLWKIRPLKERESYLLTKCMNCVHCCKPGDGTYRCKYSTKGGEPEMEHCHYERKKK